MKLFFYILSILFILTACTDPETVNPEPPSKVQMVMKQAGYDTLEIERGIDAQPDPVGGPNFIQIMWYRHEEEAKLSYFKIYRSEHPEGEVNYNLIATTENQTNELDTVFFDTQDLSIDDRYYYYVTAVNEESVESEPSDTVHYTLIEKATSLSVNNGATVITEPSITFEWFIESAQPPDYYILRVERFLGENFHPLVYLVRLQTNYEYRQTYTISGDWLITAFLNGQYRWRVDCLGTDLYSGSESDWSLFTASLE